MQLNFLPAHKLKKMLKNREISAEDIALSVIGATEKLQSRLNAYINFDKASILACAQDADKYIASGSLAHDFTGIPVAVKDNICTKNIETTCASKILSGYVPVYNATVVERLKKQGYVLCGKANMDEFAMGSSNENSAFGPVKNPWDTERVPGGSSGGPAAAVAAGMAICSLGSDTGGSIRQPASLCGVVGLKPTYGLVSRYGLIAFASSLDQIGPITRDVTDSANLLSAICGWDKYDSTSIRRASKRSEDNVSYPESSGSFNHAGAEYHGTGNFGYAANLVEDIRGLRIGVPRELMATGVDAQVKDSVENVLNLAGQMGAEVEETSLPSLEYALSVYYIIAPSEASSNLSRFDGVRYGYRNRQASSLREMYKLTRAEGFGSEVKRRIMIGTYCLSSGYYDAYYEKAQRLRTLIINDFKQSFKKYDVLISPTSPTTAFKIGEKSDDPLRMYLSDICTIPVNLAGLPAISIPSGLSANNLPIGVQIIANTLREDTLFRAAYSLEKAIGFNRIPLHLYK